jgi:hypothetical protein
MSLGERPPPPHWLGSGVGLRADLDAVEYRRKIYNMKIHGDSKLLSGVSFIGHGNLDSNVESSCTS